MIRNSFSFLSCLSPWILSLEGKLQIGIFDSREVSKVELCIISKERGSSFLIPVYFMS